MIQIQLLSSTRALAELKERQNQGLISLEEIEIHRQRISPNTWGLLMFIGYLIIGLLFNCYVEKMSALDSIYLSIITFLTIGYGDIPVKSRNFQSFYVILGCGIVGIYFSMFTNEIMETQEEVLKDKLVQAAIAMNKFAEERVERLKELKRQQHLQFMERIKDIPLENLEPVDRVRLSLSTMFLHEDSSGLAKMKAINMQVYEEELRAVRSKILVDLFFVVISLLSGATCMAIIEGWNFSEAFYWACVTTMTVGYGDVVPDTEHGKVFTIIYVIFSTALAAKGFRDVVCYPLLVRIKENEAYVLSQFSEQLTAQTLQKIIHSDLFREVDKLQYDPEQITKAEFILLVLHSMNKVSMKDILLASKCFDALDVHKEGALGQKAQQEQMALAKQRDKERMQEMLRLEAVQRIRADSSSSPIGQAFRSATSALAGLVQNAQAQIRARRNSYVSLQDEENSMEEGLRMTDSTRTNYSGSVRLHSSPIVGHKSIQPRPQPPSMGPSLPEQPTDDSDEED